MVRKVCLLILTGISCFDLQAQSLYFPPLTGSAWDTIAPQSLNWCPPRIDSLYAMLDSNNTKAFILLKDGKIVLEKYFGTHTATTPWQWASAGKTITSFMTGIAQQEGYLSISDKTSDYLGQGWTSCTLPQEDLITIRHQLTMTSGLDDSMDPYCTLSSCLEYEADAGTRWAYHNAPYTLLDSVIESATGVTLNAYTTQKLKNPTGMTGAFVPVGYNNVFFSTARSMARFGLLILNNGNWDGNQIMTDTDYFDDMVNTSQQLNESYGYLWWLNGKPTFMMPASQVVIPGPLSPDAPSDMIAALGKDGQFLDVVSSQNMVWVRMGNAPDSSLPVPVLLNDKIWEYINQLECSPSLVNENIQNNNVSIHLFPNPASDDLHITADHLISTIELLNVHGQILKHVNARSKVFDIRIADLPAGLYFIKATMEDGETRVEKFYKQ